LTCESLLLICTLGLAGRNEALMQCQYLTYGDDKSHKHAHTAGCKKTIVQQVTTATRQYFIRTAGTEVDNNNNNNNTIDIAVPNTRDLAKTITDKQNKYQELANEICAMWKQNTAQVIPLVISSMAVIPKSLQQSLKRLNLHPNTYKQIQKSVILGTCSIVRKFFKLQIRPSSLLLLITYHRIGECFPAEAEK